VKIKMFKLSNKLWFNSFEETMLARIIAPNQEEYVAKLSYPYLSEKAQEEITAGFLRSGVTTREVMKAAIGKDKIAYDTRDVTDETGRTYSILGNAFSYFVFEKGGYNWLSIFDCGDGSGSHPDSCHLNDEGLGYLIQENDIKGLIIFKRELSDENDLVKFYPWKSGNMHPIGIPGGDTADLYNYKRESMNKDIEKDIDVLFLGSVHKDFLPPKDVQCENWPYHWRQEGFRILSEIKERRKDLNIVCTTDKVPIDEYYRMISRSKICMDFPGVGWLTRRLTESLVLEKCVLRMDLRVRLPYPLKEGVHFYSCGRNYDNLENKIDEILHNPKMIENVERNLENFQDYLTPDFLSEFVRITCESRVSEFLSKEEK